MDRLPAGRIEFSCEGRSILLTGFEATVGDRSRTTRRLPPMRRLTAGDCSSIGLKAFATMNTAIARLPTT